MDKRRLVLFAHGKESGPWGSKIQALAEIAKYYDYRVESPDYSDLPDAKSRVARLLERCPENPGELIVVGFCSTPSKLERCSCPIGSSCRH